MVSYTSPISASNILKCYNVLWWYSPAHIWKSEEKFWLFKYISTINVYESRIACKSSDFCRFLCYGVNEKDNIYLSILKQFSRQNQRNKMNAVMYRKGIRHLVSAYSSHYTWIQNKGNDGNSMVTIFNLVIFISMNQDTSGIKYWDVFKEHNYIYSPLRHTCKNSHS